MPRGAFWFDRLFSFLRLGRLAGSVIVGCGLFALLFGLVYLVEGAEASALPSEVVFFLPVVFLTTILATYGSVFVAGRLEQLAEYASKLAPMDTTIDTRHIYSFRYTMYVAITLILISQPIYIFSVLPQSATLSTKIVFSIPFVYWNFYLNTFFWTWAYSLFSLYRMGKLSTRLKPFTEDRTLGLRPFGRTSLLLSAIYIGIIGIVFLPQVPLGLTSVPLLIFAAGMLSLGFVFFLLPLLPLRTKMIQAKQEASALVGPRYTRAIESLRARGEGPVDANLVMEISTVDKIEKDVHQIHTWPFDTSLVIRLSAIILTVVGIVLARIVQLALHLAT